MSKIFQIALGILAAIGGFVDIGDLVFNVEAGATLGYQLLWVVVVGVVGIIVYSEMCGRVAAVSKRPVFDAIRERLGFGVGFGALVASQIVNLMTLAAEVGGVALALELLSGLPYRVLIVLGVAALAVVIWVAPFEWIERIFGYGGLALLVFVVAAIKLHPDWGDVATGFVPHGTSSDKLVYAYFAVGLLGAAMTPYEVYFYSSGVVEEGWTPKDLGLNRANAIIGYSLGGTSVACVDDRRRRALPASGRRAAVHRDGCSRGAGATGDDRPPARARRHPVRRRRGGDRHLLFRCIQRCSVLRLGVGQGPPPEWCAPVHARLDRPSLPGVAGDHDRRRSGAVTEYAVIFSVVALPLTYIPILLVANDRAYMGQYVNGRLANALGLFYLVVILIVAVTAIPLMILTHQGQG